METELSASPPALKEIRRVARAARVLALCAAAVLAVFPFVVSLDGQLLSQAMRSMPALREHTLDLTPARRVAVFLAMLPSVGVGLLVVGQLWTLFGGYARGQIFSLAAALRLRRLGLAVMSLFVARPLTTALLSAVVTSNAPPGQRHVVLSLGSDDYFCLLMGVVLLAIARVMREAARLAQENAEFV
jgi:hypothetical protein